VEGTEGRKLRMRGLRKGEGGKLPMLAIVPP
jgi:hypothetical protein